MTLLTLASRLTFEITPRPTRNQQKMKHLCERYPALEIRTVAARMVSVFLVKYLVTSLAECDVDVEVTRWSNLLTCLAECDVDVDVTGWSNLLTSLVECDVDVEVTGWSNLFSFCRRHFDCIQHSVTSSWRLLTPRTEVVAKMRS